MGDRQLRDEEMELLREAVSRYRPNLLPLLDLLGKSALTLEEREGLREAVANELSASGLRPDDEPNQRGLRLEDLIDRLGHL